VLYGIYAEKGVIDVNATLESRSVAHAPFNPPGASAARHHRRSGARRSGSALVLRFLIPGDITSEYVRSSAG
jgi:hypothetical protein